MLPLLSGYKNKRIKQKGVASKMKLFVTLVDGFFGKLNNKLSNVTKSPISNVAGA